jgi:OPA family glycerol-3-phosphate transporter-like MFS transporter
VTTAPQTVWRVRILTTTWLSYAGFYLCRKNFAIVKSSVQDAMEISNSELAHIFTAYLVAYMLGQFLTSFLGRTVTTRVLLLAGMAITAACNVAFGFTELLGPGGYWPMIALMIVNGFAQATGWPGNVGVLSNWLSRRERGRVMAVWATCYQLGSIFAKVFAAFMLGFAGWAWSFWGAAAIMLGIWIVFFLFQRDRPEDVGLEPMVEEITLPPGAEPPPVNRLGWNRNVVTTILFMGSCYFIFKFLRYALDSWSPMAIEQLFGMDRDHAGYISTVFDWVGFLGVLAAGWLSDRVFRGRRYQTIVIMTVGMLLAFVFLAWAGSVSVWMFAVALSLCGFMLMGPDSLLAGVGAIDVGGRRGAVVAAGLINGLGSIGPIFQEQIIGWLLDEYGYAESFLLLIGMACIGVVGVIFLALRSQRNLSTL